MAASLVDKATSDLLIGPDWAMNMEICDIINSDPGQAKDVVKALKKRLGSKNSKVQLLALTVLETMVKNCGVVVHQQVAEKDILHEMVKIVKRKTDMHVRDKILVLLDSWQHAFGGPRGRYPQYYMAYEELRRIGVEFPERAPENDAPIFTPPQTHPITAPVVPGFGSPANLPARLEALMSSDLPGLSLTEIDTARGRLEVLNEMLNALNPQDRQAVKDELIMELVEQCRSTQQRVRHLVNNTSDEELLRQGLALNDELQRTLEKHDAIAAGAPLPQVAGAVPQLRNTGLVQHEEEDDDFAQLAHRSSKNRTQKSSQPLSQVGTQASLPPPPQPTLKPHVPGLAAGKKEETIDLLSGDTYQGTVSSTAGTSTVLNTPVRPSISQTPPSVSPPSVSLQASSGNPFVSDNVFHAKPYGSGQSPPASSMNPQSHGVPSATPQGYAFPQYQQYSQGQGLNQLGQRNYVASWALPTSQSFGPQQESQPPSVRVSVPEVQSQSLPAGNPVAPWETPIQQPISPQQRAMLFGNTVMQSPYSQQQGFLTPQGSFQYPTRVPNEGQTYPFQNGSQYMLTQQAGGSDQFAVATITQKPTSSQSKAAKPSDKLFEDLVDLQSLNTKFKSAGMSSSLSRPSSS